MYVTNTLVGGTLAILLVLLFLVFALRYTLMRADKDLRKERAVSRHLATHLVESYIMLSRFKQNATTPPPGLNPEDLTATFDDDIKHVMQILGSEYLGPGADEFLQSSTEAGQ